MRTLAKRFGISDVGLAKTCRRHKIPRPHRGYWQQKQHGKTVRVVPLPPLKPDDKHLEAVTLTPSNRRRRAKEEETGPVAEQRKYEKDHQILVPEYILHLHPLVREMQAYCRGAERSRFTYRGQRQASQAAVDVAPDSLPRALRILDTLIRALEERDFPVTIDRESDALRAVVAVQDTTVGIRLEERRKQVEIAPSASDVVLSDAYPWRSNPRKEAQYTGKFALKIAEDWAKGVRRKWADGKTQRVEDCLNAFVVGLVQAAEAKKQAQAEWEEQQRRREEERRRRFEEERQRQEEARRGRQLEEEATAWAKAEQLRAYVAAVREHAEQAGGVEPESKVARWLAWAERYAEAADPLAARVGDETQVANE
jgi:hypothetical protein